MFKRTYGIIYEQNSFCLPICSKSWRNISPKGNVDLIEVMDKFFSVLYQKMFTVLNAQYTFDDKYLVCVSEHMKDLKPFGDVPSKLSVQLKRSFVATRTFQQSLNVAGDIVHNMINMPISLECARSMTKMAGCPMCQGYPNLKPCYNYCANVMKGCVAFQSELDREWNSFVDAIEKIAERLLGPFNIEMVVEPINIKISEAIMNFQENSQHVSQRVFSGCGKPILGRRKRQVSTNSGRTNSRPSFPLSEDIDEEEEEDEDEDEEDEDEEEDEEPVINNRQGNPRRIGGGSNEEMKVEGKGEGESEGEKEREEKTGGETGNSSSNDLDKLIKDIRGRVRQTRNFWSKLPYQMCNENDYFSSGAQDDNCWNGADRARYTTSIIGDGLRNQARNPEVRVDTTRTNSLLTEQSYALRTISTKLKTAYNGMDVEWIDAPEESIILAGSGSGWGGPDDDEDTIFREDPVSSSSQSPPLYPSIYDGSDSSTTEDESSVSGHSGSSSSSPIPEITHIDLSLPSSTHSPSHSGDMDHGGPHDMDRGPHGVDRDHEQDHTLDSPSQNGGQTPYGHDRNHDDRHGSHSIDSNNGNSIPGLNPTGSPPGQGDDNNHEDNNLSPVSGFKMEGNKNKYNVSGGDRPSLNKALVSFLVPCLMMWVGNSLTDWWIL
ncbi:hypothetical protein WDU94_002135 [Cyamophila willieti]